jgi:mycothiol system anti-sigma-R factor
MSSEEGEQKKMGSEQPPLGAPFGNWYDRPVYDPCQEAIATLYTFLDGELTADRRETIQRHLDECSPCFEAFGFESELKAVIARNCREEVPESLRRRVAEALRAEGLAT